MRPTLAFLTSLLSASSVLASPLEERATIQVTLYDGKNGSGNHITLNLTPGYCTNLPAGWKNRASSMQKPANVQCRIYDGDSCSRHRHTYDVGVRFVCKFSDEQYNDTNSIECQ
ncbi:hypothetical protein B0I37DRAFT_206375 [Chaetomium sp. MPI-CAGE-AT-0009]|nr:hypothetical protein B0I37DRAFT_206375 [Chaetomium sp. MPI-CAGE-AT-0009]